MYGLGAIPAYHQTLFALSALMPLGTGTILAVSLSKKKYAEPAPTPAA
jgi:hypothetical protein